MKVNDLDVEPLNFSENAKEFLTDMIKHPNDIDFKKAYGFSYKNKGFVEVFCQSGKDLKELTGRDVISEFKDFLNYQVKWNTNVGVYADEVLADIEAIEKG